MACNFILCLHNHQPVGNVDHVLERGYTDSYNKTIDILMNYPEFKFSVHHSGPLLEWIERHHPDYLDKLRVMVDRGQLE
ncbi:MAG TPA: 4-alpha-glucanotransferase, partial [Spirochaetota bacterium]|nr:4-alpha-glucanotransferase [Spirochaetota bacterium]